MVRPATTPMTMPAMAPPDMPEDFLVLSGRAVEEADGVGDDELEADEPDDVGEADLPEAGLLEVAEAGDDDRDVPVDVDEEDVAEDLSEEDETAVAEDAESLDWPFCCAIHWVKAGVSSTT